MKILEAKRFDLDFFFSPFSVNDTFDNDNQFLTSIEKIMPTADEAGNGNEFGIEETSYQEMLQSNVRRMSSAVIF